MAKKTGVTRTSISVLRDLKKRMNKVKEPVNWSGIACRAFEIHLGDITAKKEHKKMSDVIMNLIEYEVEWTQCPTAYNRPRVLFIKAQNEDDARVLARDHIKRSFGIGQSVIDKVTETKKMPEGGVVAPSKSKER